MGDKPLPKPSNKDILNQMYGEKPQDTKVSAHFSEIELKDWKWRHFQQYCDSRYQETLSRIPPGLSRKDYPKMKGIIDAAVKQWGREIFKGMIDYVFDNIAYYPKWDNPGMSLVCGNHYWSNMIANEVQKGL